MGDQALSSISVEIAHAAEVVPVKIKRGFDCQDEEICWGSSFLQLSTEVQSWYPAAIGSIIPAVSNRVPGITVTECEGASAVVLVQLQEVAPLER